MTAAAMTIAVYLVGVTLLGAYLSKRAHNSQDWATGGGQLGILLIAAGVAGTRIGGAGSYGVAGDVINTGLWNIWYGINTFLALALVGLFFAVPYRRLGLTTIGELFVRRYGKARCAMLTSLCVQTEYLVVNVIEPLLIGVIISSVTGIPLVVGIAIGATVIILATTSSGLRGTALTNIVHVAVIIGGLALVGWVGMQELGGWARLTDRVDTMLIAADVDPSQWWSIAGQGWLPVLAMFFSATIHTPAASVYVNYSSSAAKESVLVPAFLIAGGLAALMPMLAAVIGMEALARYGLESGIQGYQSITRIALDAGPIIGGVALAAVLAALISSGGPILLASATMFVNDWIPGSDKFSPVRKLKAYRIVAVLYGILAAGIACIFGYYIGTASVLEWLLLGFAMVVPPAIAIGFIFYWRRTSEPAVFWGIGCGYGLGVLGWAVNKLFIGSEVDVATYLATGVPLVVIPLVSLLTAPAEENERTGHFYHALKTPG